MERKKIRKITFKLHSIVGLLTGIVVFIVSITGCLWVFKDEIENLYSDYKNVSTIDKDFITSFSS